MKSEEALEHIEYLKEITAKTRLKAAYGYPYIILWGIITAAGYICESIFPHHLIIIQWSVLWIIGTTGTCIILFFLRKKHSYPTLLKRIGMQCMVILLTDILLFGVLIHYKAYEILHVYWPFQFGILYIVAGIHMSRDMLYIGLWLLITGLASFAISESFQNIWLAATFGGGLIFTGLLFRYQTRKTKNQISK